MLNKIKKAIATGNDKETIKVLMGALIQRHKSESLLLEGTIDIVTEHKPEDPHIAEMLGNIKKELDETRVELLIIKAGM